jgi:hypothetical protein
VTDEPKTYCISLRVRRVVVQDAYISVPLNAAITMKREDGTGGIDTDAFMREGMRLAEDPGFEWQVESSVIEPHPGQQRRPEGRRSFGCPHCCG